MLQPLMKLATAAAVAYVCAEQPASLPLAPSRHQQAAQAGNQAKRRSAHRRRSQSGKSSVMVVPRPARELSLTWPR